MIRASLRVLKKLGLLGSAGETTTLYAEFMRKETGAAALGRAIGRVYAQLFENVTSPEKASNDELTNFFNIYSGGSEGTIKFQIDTFKALAVYATFGDADPLENPEKGDANDAPEGAIGRRPSRTSGEPAIRIDLHIHLPENKSKSDYDAIIESIATHLYKRSS